MGQSSLDGALPIVRLADAGQPAERGVRLRRFWEHSGSRHALAWTGALVVAIILGWSIRSASVTPASPHPLPVADRVVAPAPVPPPVAPGPEARPEPSRSPDDEASNEKQPSPAPREQPPKPARVSLTSQEIVTRSEGSVALIAGSLGSGSGFVVAPGLVATNAHVIDREPVHRIEIHFPSAMPADRGPFKARLSYQDTHRDLALLQADIPHKPLPLCRSHIFQRGEEVTTIGSPGVRGNVLLKNAVSRGLLSTEVDLDGQRFFQLSAPVNSGNSGGPAFDSSGEVIGVVTLKAVGKDSIGFCIPARDLIAAIEKTAAVSGEQMAVAERTHDVESIARRLHLARSINRRAIRAYLEALKEQSMMGGSLPLAIQETKRSIGPELAEKNDGITGSIRSEIQELSADARLPFQLRRDLELLWDAFVALRSFVESPPEDPRVFLERMREAQDRFDQQAERMNRALGIDPLD
ncbi:MAG: S1C family serine protease [Isosphaeraceae bacterium]